MIKYVNSTNEEINFDEIGHVQSITQFLGHSWNTEYKYNRITNFKREIVQYPLPIVLSENGIDKLKTIVDIVEKDVRNKSYGRLYFGDWYMQGYFLSVQTKNLYSRGNKLVLELTFASDSLFWVSEKKYVYRKDDETSQERGLGYSYDYPYDYISSMNALTVNNSSNMPVDFVCNIYGAVNNPRITIGGHVYGVNVSVYAHEYLTIDTRAKTIVKTNARGVKTNCYANRLLDSYVFEPIAPGVNTVVVGTPCDIDLTLFHERSQAEWN